MKLFISRHGEASFDASTDRDRSLTARGVVQTQEIMEANLHGLSCVTKVWSSDLLRAKQTASIYAKKLKIDILEKPLLSPDGGPSRVLKELSSLKAEDNLLIVSHQPLVGELVSVLCEGNVYQAHPYATSEVVVIECDIAEPGMGEKIANYLPSITKRKT